MNNYDYQFIYPYYHLNIVLEYVEIISREEKIREDKQGKS